MADKIEHINANDVLNTGRDKINRFAIDPAMRAETNSVDAKRTAEQSNQKANESKAIAKNTDSRLDNIVSEEMKDAEVIDARKPFGKESYESLGKRLDAKDKNDENRDVILNNKVDLEDRNKTNSSIRVATFNIKDSLTKYNEAGEILKQNNVDIVGIQEMKYPRVGDQLESSIDLTIDRYVKNDFIDQHYFYMKRNSGVQVQGIATLSKYSIVNKYSKHYTYVDSNENNCYTRDEVVIDGKILALYNTHIGHKTTTEITYQIAELAQDIENDEAEYIIVLGDFNTQLDGGGGEYMKPLIESELISIQGYNGQIWDTYTSRDDGSKRSLDHIFVSPNLKIKNVNMADASDISDHNLFYVDLEMDNDVGNLKNEIYEHQKKVVNSFQDVHGLLKFGKIIAETGSNSNGTFIKLSNGIMFAFGSATLKYANADMLIGTWVYPHVFGWGVSPTVIALPEYSSEGLAPFRWGNFVQSGKGRGQTDFRLYKNPESTASWQEAHTVDVEVFAVGRWKYE